MGAAPAATALRRALAEGGQVLCAPTDAPLLLVLFPQRSAFRRRGRNAHACPRLPIGNAIFAATGIRFRSLPLLPGVTLAKTSWRRFSFPRDYPAVLFERTATQIRATGSLMTWSGLPYGLRSGLAARPEGLLSSRCGYEQKKMFGGIRRLLNGNIRVGVIKDG
jgi:hypothetical protein